MPATTPTRATRKYGRPKRSVELGARSLGGDGEQRAQRHAAEEYTWTGPADAPRTSQAQADVVRALEQSEWDLIQQEARFSFMVDYPCDVLLQFEGTFTWRGSRWQSRPTHTRRFYGKRNWRRGR